MDEWYKNPTILIVAGVGVLAGFILLRNQKAQPSTTSNTQQPVSQNNPQNITAQAMNGGVIGGSYSYLDGTGMQHIVATDPYGNLVGYNNMPPSVGNPQPGELSGYVGAMGTSPYMTSSYGAGTPYYSLGGYYIPNMMAPYTL